MSDPFIAYQGGDPNDTRFQFDVIKHLSESVRQLAAGMADMQKTQVGMLERLATLEAGKMTSRLDEIDTKVSALEQDRYRRDGALGMLGVLRVWGPVIFSALAAFWLFGRSAGVVPPPPNAPARVEATVIPTERRIEGVVGGKP